MRKKLIAFLSLCSLLLLFGCQSSRSNEEAEITSSFSVQTSASPNQLKIIEIQEMHTEDNVGLHASGSPMFHSFRIYYGEYGSLLEDYVVINGIQMFDIGHFEMVWTDDDHVTINVMPQNAAGGDVEIESYGFDFTTQRLSKIS